MKKIELSIQNPYTTKTLRPDRKPTVFARALSRLSKEGKNPGKLIPIFIFIEEDYKIFGILTLNSGGSISFFPDFYNLENFDHLTLNADFLQKKGHLTKVELDGKRLKPINLEASELKGGIYNLITFAMKDSDMLMDAPPQIELPLILYDNEEQRIKYNAWLNESVSAGHCILRFPKGDGFYCIQILVIPKQKTINELAIDRGTIEKFLSEPTSLEGEIFNVTKIEIPANGDFSICILAFRVPHELKVPVGFLMAQDRNKPPPKSIEIH